MFVEWRTRLPYLELTAPTPYGVGFQEGLPAPRSVGYAAILKPQGHLAAA